MLVILYVCNFMYTQVKSFEAINGYKYNTLQNIKGYMKMLRFR